MGVLAEQLRIHGSDRGKVDALIAGLRQPVARPALRWERADLLLALIQDERVGQETGSDGSSIRVVAYKALVALGVPYAQLHPVPSRRTSASYRQG